jgi:hypothetical protein
MHDVGLHTLSLAQTRANVQGGRALLTTEMTREMMSAMLALSLWDNACGAVRDTTKKRAGESSPVF